jgi:hypothetical protein
MTFADAIARSWRSFRPAQSTLPMFKRFLFVILMGAAIGLPYVVTSSPEWWNRLTGSTEAAADSKSVAPAFDAKAGGPLVAVTSKYPGATNSPAKPRGVEGTPSQDLAEFLQFDGTPAWVMSRWPRVTAGLAAPDLQGYRVPLVTGTREDDLAGSLTYYFDKTQHVALIIFHGTTGDPSKLVALFTSRYNFEPQQAPDPSLHLYQVKWNGKPKSELKIRPVRVVRADQPNARYEVDFAMKRP